MLSKRKSAGRYTKQNQEWDANINALLRLARVQTKTIEAPLRSVNAPLQYQVSSSIDQPLLEEGNNRQNDIKEIHDVIQKIAIHINKLEMQQESSSACTLKRLQEIQEQIDKQPKVDLNTYFHEELNTVERKCHQEINELQIALNYIKDKLLNKLSELESTVVHSTRRNDNSLKEAIESLHAESERRFKVLEQAAKETDAKCAATFNSMGRDIKDQITNMVEEIAKSCVLDYARKKEEEDCRRLNGIDKRITELELFREEICKEIDTVKLDMKVNAKKELAFNKKNKEMDQNMTRVLAELKAFQNKANTEDKHRKSQIQDYWSKLHNELRVSQDNYEIEFDKINARLIENIGSITALSEDLAKLKSRTTEKIDNELEVIERRRRNLESEMEELKNKLDIIPEMKAKIREMESKQEKIDREVKAMNRENERLKNDVNRNKSETMTSLRNVERAMENMKANATAKTKGLVADNKSAMRNEISQLKTNLIRDTQGDQYRVITSEYSISRKKDDILKKDKDPVTRNEVKRHKDSKEDIVSEPLRLLEDEIGKHTDSKENNESVEKSNSKQVSTPKLELESIKTDNEDVKQQQQNSDSDDFDDLYPKDMSTNYKVNIAGPVKLEPTNAIKE